MIASTWFRRLGRSASRPESSAAQRSNACRSGFRSESLDLASAWAASGVRHAVPGLRPALLWLPLLLGLAAPAAAQHSLSPTPAELYEGETRTFTVVFNASAVGITPTVTVTGGTATNNTDYTLSNRQTIASGALTTGVSFDIAGTTDSLNNEGNETINIQAYIDAVDRFNFTITLKDGSRPSPTVDSTSITEGQTKTFTVSNIPLSWTGTPSTSLGLISASTVGSCPESIDILAPNWDVCNNFSAETWNSGTRVFTFRLRARQDSVSDDGETFTVSVEDGDDSSRSVSFTITISDVAQPTVTITGGAAVTEGSDATFTLNLNPAPTANLQVDFTVSEETGDNQSFVTTGDFTVEVVASATSQTFTVPTVNDSTDEPAGSVTATVNGRTGYNVGTPSSASVTVNDDDTPTLSIAAAFSDNNEGNMGIATHTEDFLVTLSGPTVVGNVDFRVCFSGTATLDTDTNNDFPSGEDYQVFLSGANQHGNCVDNTVRAGQTTNLSTIGIGINGDTAVEPDETVIATLTLRGTSNPPDVSLGTDTATFTILNDDTDVSRSDFAFLGSYDTTLERSEGAAGRSHFLVTRVRVPGENDDLATFEQIPDPWGFRLCFEGTATLGEDYRVFNRSNRPLSLDNDDCSPANSKNDGTGLAAGQDRAHFYIQVIDDAHEDSGETIVVILDGAVGTSLYDFDSSFPGNPDGYSNAIREDCARGGPCPTDRLIFTILNHDGPPPAAGPYADLVAKIYGWRNDPKWKSYKAHTDRWDRALLAFGENVKDASLQPMSAAQAQVFADRGWQRWVEVAKALHEIEAARLSPPGAALRAVLSAPSGDVAEAGGRKTLTIALGRALEQGEVLSIPLVFGGMAKLGDDYTLAAPGTVSQGVSYANLASADPAAPPVVTFTGPSAQSATLVLTATADGIDEGTGETVTVATGTLAATGLDDGAEGEGTAAFAVVEPPLAVSVSAAVASLTEGAEATFTVTASRAPASDLAVRLTVSDAPGSDFLAATSEGSHTVTIAKGTTEAAFAVATVDDSAHEPDGPIAVTVTKGAGYAVAGAPGDTASVAVVDDDTAPAVPELAIGDATANESDRFMWFTVTLGTASNRPVSVSYRTRESNPVSARSNSDFLQYDFGSLTFSPGETSKRFWVYIFDDSHDEGAETFEVVLSSPTGGARIADGVAVGTILNDDPLPAAWHLRFGRTVSQQVVDALQDRLSSPAPLETGLQLTLAGEDFTSDTPLAENQSLLSKALGFENVSPQLLVEGSSFSFAPQGETGPQFALWGQGALSSFSGQEDEVSLDGDVTTLLLGADWSATRWQAGAALSHSWGNGSYNGEDGADGEISTSLTGMFPYGRYALSPRLGIWATAGYGWGDLSLKPDGNGEEYEPDTTMTMVALGMDGLLLDGGSEGVSLNATADLLSLNATSDEVEGLESSEGNVSRFRLGLEATRPFPLANGSSLLPSMEVGIRQDGGDAETGFGLDLGAGITWKDPERGISGELRGRTILTHAEEEFQDQGLALSFSWDPSPSNRGPSLSMGHAMGATATADMDALFNPATFEQMDGNASSEQQFEAELAYGFPVHNDRLTLTPAMALALSSTSRNYGLLWSLAPYSEQSHARPWELSIEAERLEYFSSATPANHSLKLNFSSSF